MAKTTTTAIGSWNTLHENGPWPTRLLHNTELAKKADMPLQIERYNDVAGEMQRLFADAISKGEGFRAIGSRWSMSHIAHQKDNIHVNALMNLKIKPEPNQLHPDTDFLAENLFLIQCGNVIKEIHNFLNDFGKSMKTTGASNGQTIAGCISTGVHGSALDIGSVQDYVVGLSIITGPDPEDRVYLERASKPALSDEFAGIIQSKIIRDDGMFNAALVSLGSFGFIHGVVIEAEDRFLLKRYVKKISKDLALDLAATLDFENSSFKIPSETDAAGKGIRPYHYKVFINPYVNDNEYVIELMYKKPYQSGYPDPVPAIKTSLYKDLVYLFIKIAQTWQNSIPKLIQILQNSILPPVDAEATGMLGEIFYDAGYQGPAFACSVGVDHRDSPKALQLLVDLAKDEGPVPGIYAMRFVKQSGATLAFTKFPITCMLEIDGLIWDGGPHGMITMERFYTRITEVLQENNIAFTLHWGKNADWAFPALTEYMYGERVGEWKTYRNELLSPQARALFSNDFLRHIRLDQ
jgi:hypothetical protein